MLMWTKKMLQLKIMHHLECSQNYSIKSGSLRNYYKGEIDNADDNTSYGKSCKYKTDIIGKTEVWTQRTPWEDLNVQGNQSPRPNQPPIPPLNTEVVVLLKYLSNFWRSLDLPLINCETEINLKWTKNCVLIEEEGNITGAGFTITRTKLYVPVASFSINYNIKFWENKARV